MMTRHSYSPCSCSRVDGHGDPAPRPGTTCVCSISAAVALPSSNREHQVRRRSSARAYTDPASASPQFWGTRCKLSAPRPRRDNGAALDMGVELATSLSLGRALWSAGGTAGRASRVDPPKLPRAKRGRAEPTPRSHHQRGSAEPSDTPARLSNRAPKPNHAQPPATRFTGDLRRLGGPHRLAESLARTPPAAVLVALPTESDVSGRPRCTARLRLASVASSDCPCSGCLIKRSKRRFSRLGSTYSGGRWALRGFELWP
jgi:hypothetical protein